MDNVWLYVIIFYWGNVREHRYEMPDLETCQKAVATMVFEANDGDENESGIAAYCATERTERRYSSTWWTDKRERVDD